MNPTTEQLFLNSMKVTVNSILDFSPDLSLMVVLSENGKGSLYSTNLLNLTSLVSNRLKPALRVIDCNNCIEMVIKKSWQMHNINPELGEASIIIKFMGQRRMFMSATNSGEVKLWDYEGNSIAKVNEENYSLKNY